MQMQTDQTFLPMNDAVLAWKWIQRQRAPVGVGNYSIREDAGVIAVFPGVDSDLYFITWLESSIGPTLVL
jgi:hypothetical protein